MKNDRNRTQTGSGSDRSSEIGRGKTGGSEEMRKSGSDQMAKNDPARSGGQEAPGRMAADRNQSRHTTLSPQDEQEAREKIRRDAKKDPGLPTGAIHGQDSKIRSVPNDFQRGEEKNR